MKEIKDKKKKKKKEKKKKVKEPKGKKAVGNRDPRDLLIEVIFSGFKNPLINSHSSLKLALQRSYIPLNSMNSWEDSVNLVLFNNNKKK